MTTAREIAQAVANEIESSGHYQPTQGRRTGCCVISNDYLDAIPYPASDAARRTLTSALAPVLHIEDDFRASMNIVDWNDETPTQEVLDTLRSIV